MGDDGRRSQCDLILAASPSSSFDFGVDAQGQNLRYMNIKVGAVTPLAGIMKFVFKLSLVFFLARYLELVPMACIGGILLWVASNMVKPTEIRQVFAHNWVHASLMIYTAVMVILFDFLTGVLSAMFLYGVLFKFLDKPPTVGGRHKEPQRRPA